MPQVKQRNSVQAYIDQEGQRPSLYDESFMEHLLQLAVAEPVSPLSWEGMALSEMHDNAYLNSSFGSFTECTNREKTPNGIRSGNPIPLNSNQRAILASQNVVERNEDATIALYSLIARSLNAEDYWTNLRSQVEVDQHVTFVQFCAAKRFRALKAIHLLQWLQRFQKMVVQGTASGVQSSFSTVESAGGILCDAHPAAELSLNPIGGEPPSQVDRHTSGGSTTAESELPLSKRGAESSRGKSRKDHKGRKSTRQSTLTERKAKTDQEDAEVAAEMAHTGADDPAHSEVSNESLQQASPPLLEDNLRDTIRRFLANELQEGWRWAQLLKQPVKLEQNSLSLSKGKKGHKNDKLRLKLQQEYEEELKRQAVIASLPRENIYLSKDEIAPFTTFFLRNGMLQHAALYKYMDSHQQALEHSHLFQLAVEEPMHMPPLTTAKVTSDVPSKLVTVDIPSTEKPNEKAARRRNGNTHGRGNATSNEVDAAAVIAPAPPVQPPSALEALRAQQQFEQGIFHREHAEAVAKAEERARIEQTQREMELLFEKEGTKKAVEDVYESMQKEVTKRQLHILQRIEAIERSLGVPKPGESSKVDDTTRPVSKSKNRKPSTSPRRK